MLNFTAKGKVVKKILIAVVITYTGFLVGGSVSVLAGNIQVGGGVWNHGVTGVLHGEMYGLIIIILVKLILQQLVTEKQNVVFLKKVKK